MDNLNVVYDTKTKQSVCRAERMNLDEIKNQCNFRPAECCGTCFWCSLFLAMYICRKNNHMPIARHMICDKYEYDELAEKALRVRHECVYQDEEQSE